MGFVVLAAIVCVAAGLVVRRNRERARNAPLRGAILERAVVRRLPDGAVLTARGAPAAEWVGVAAGAVRVSSVSLSGKQITLTYVEPGTWFGDIALFDGSWECVDAAPGSEIVFSARLDMGIPSLADALEPIAVRTMTDNIVSIVRGLVGHAELVATDVAVPAPVGSGS